MVISWGVAVCGIEWWFVMSNEVGRKYSHHVPERTGER